MITKYLLHWNAIIHLWYLSKNDLLSMPSSGFWSEQSSSKQDQDEGNNEGAEEPFLSAVCVITADVRGWMRAQAKIEGEKRRQLKGMFKQENFITRRPVMHCETVSVLQMLSSICPRCTGPAPLALSHCPSGTVTARLGAVPFPTHVLTDKRVHLSVGAHGVGWSPTVFCSQR